MSYANRGKAMSPERLQELRTAAQSGLNMTQICEKYRVSDNTLRRYRVFEDVLVTPHNGRLARPATPEQVEKIRKLVKTGETLDEICRAVGMSGRQVRKTLEDNGLRLLTWSERCALGKTKRGPKPRLRPADREPAHGGRLISRKNQAPEWAPRADATELEAAVTRLRRKYKPVCAEDTIARRHFVPNPYTPDTLFRVGRRQNVPAVKLLEMARHV